MDPIQADEMAKNVLELLQESSLAIPNPDLDWSLLDGWEDRAPALMRV